MKTFINHLMIDGIDCLGKDTLINNIINKCGYYQVMHFSKPKVLSCYSPNGPLTQTERTTALRKYQEAGFRNMFSMFRDAPYSKLIANRSHLGENVYAPLYRGYSGDYVFDLEATFMRNVTGTRLILLTENFNFSKHFVDDGFSFNIQKREEEQEMFLSAFERSCIIDKRVICVTDINTGNFRSPEQILELALN
jgi:hypothetical protein